MMFAMVLPRFVANASSWFSKRLPMVFGKHHGVYPKGNSLRPFFPATQEWAIHDCKSLNGVTVNGEAIGEDGRTAKITRCRWSPWSFTNAS